MEQEELVSRAKTILDNLKGLSYQEASSVMTVVNGAISHKANILTPITFENTSADECISEALRYKKLDKNGKIFEYFCG